VYLRIGSFRAAACDTDNCLAVAKFGGRLAVSKQTTHRFHMEILHFKELNDIEGKAQNRFEDSNRFVALGNLGANVNINRAWKVIIEHIKMSA
jgi:hypothetical protein